MATGSDDNTVIVWKQGVDASFACMQVLSAHASVYSVIYNANHVVCGCSDNSIKVWGHEGGSAPHLQSTIQAHSGSVFKLQAIDDGMLISASDDQTVRIWAASEVETYRCDEVLQGHAGFVLCVDCDNSGDTLVSGDDEGKMLVWRVGDDGQYRIVQSLERHSSDVLCVTVDTLSGRMVSSSCDKDVVLWGIGEDCLYEELQVLGGHTDRVTCATFGREGTMLASGSRDSTVKLWGKTEKGAFELSQTLCVDSEVTCISFLADSNMLIVCTEKGSVFSSCLQEESGLYNITNTNVAPCGCITSISLLDNECFATGSSKNIVSLWKCSQDGTLVIWQELHHNCSPTSVFSDKTQTIAVGLGSGEIWYWSKQEDGNYSVRNKVKAHLDHVSRLAGFGRSVVSASWDTTVGVWDNLA
mmetsp:Transcript_19385/g.49688  ORF Transcript_19385/g.49688 Transcript_19385/m.49688 type:complete len:414 (-) Transcript_19385:101-1342(-)